MMEKRKHRGMLILLLGGVLMLLGACLLAGMDNLMQYVMPAPASTQEGGELEALYEEGQKQLEAMADALFPEPSARANRASIWLRRMAKACRPRCMRWALDISMCCMRRCKTAA